MKFALHAPSGMDCFGDLFQRSDDKRTMTGFSERLKVILSQHPEGLKKTLELLSQAYCSGTVILAI